MNALVRILVPSVGAVLLVAAVSHADCDKAVVDRMLDMYQLNSGSYEIEILSNPLRSADLTAADVAIYPLTSKEPVGLFAVEVKVSRDGRVVESGQVRMKIRRYADVLVTVERITSRDAFTPEQLVIRRMDVTSLHERPLVALAEVAGKRAKRNLRPGMILTSSCIEEVPDIERGRDLTIVYADGLCRVTAVGVALESGLAGDYIRVKNTRSGKVLTARVIDGGAVAVDP